MTHEKNAAFAARTAMTELLKQLRDDLTPLPPAWEAKAEELAVQATALAADFVSGVIDGAQFEKGKRALVVSAELMVAQTGLDLLGRKKAFIQKAIPVVIQTIMAII